MRIWVDADACPGAIKDLVIRCAMRLKIPTIFVANKWIGTPESVYLKTVRVGMEPDEADAYITANAEPVDFVITQDIPLASLLVPKGLVVLNPRGEIYTEENIRERLSVRNFMQDLREAGAVTPGPKPFGPKEKQRFADSLDRELTKALKNKGAPPTKSNP